MTAPTREQELAALRRPFAVGLGVVALAVVAIGAVVAAFGSTADRPAGIAERWLVAVGDLTRDGVEADARDRIEELSADAAGGLDLASTLAALSPTADHEGKAAFETVRVGPPLEIDAEAGVVVPVEVVPRDAERLRTLIRLVEVDDRWRVDTVASSGSTAEAACAGLGECEGFPIERPERAPIGWFVGALALGVVITLGCVAAVRAATPRPS